MSLECMDLSRSPSLGVILIQGTLVIHCPRNMLKVTKNVVNLNNWRYLPKDLIKFLHKIHKCISLKSNPFVDLYNLYPTGGDVALREWKRVSKANIFAGVEFFPSDVTSTKNTNRYIYI